METFAILPVNYDKVDADRAAWEQISYHLWDILKGCIKFDQQFQLLLLNNNFIFFFIKIDYFLYVNSW